MSRRNQEHYIFRPKRAHAPKSSESGKRHGKKKNWLENSLRRSIEKPAATVRGAAKTALVPVFKKAPCRPHRPVPKTAIHSYPAQWAMVEGNAPVIFAPH